MDPRPAAAAPANRLLAIAIAAFAVLFFQIAVTRVLSVVLWYHWAFLSVSLAMLGLGAPGVWFAIRRPGPRTLPWLLLTGGLAMPGSIVAILAITLHLGHDKFGDLGPWAVVACMGCVLVPMLLLGAAVCILLLEAPGAQVARMYGADLIGASIAAAAVLPVLSWLPTPIACALFGLLPVWAAWRCGVGIVAAGLAAAAIVGVSVVDGPLQVKRSKLYLEIVDMYERWTPTARLTFFDVQEAQAKLGIKDERGHAWGRGSKAPLSSVQQFWMEQDGTAGTPITRFDGDVKDMSEFEFLLYDVTAAGYEVRPPKRVAIIGGGGGRDILTALKSGAGDVDVAEFNAGVVETVSTRYREFAGDIYHAPGVHAHTSEGRSFLTRSPGNYDLIQISLIDSWAATAAGAYTLAENNLYTVEAFRLYLDKLGPNGVLSTSRWRSGVFGLEGDRLVLLGRAALRQNGVTDPASHMIAIGADKVSTLLLSRRPFDVAEIERARAVCEQRGFELLHPLPVAAAPRHIESLLRDGAAEGEARGLMLAPPTDDKPFFFQSLPIFGRFDLEFARQQGVNEEGVATLQLLMMVVTGFTLLLFFAPFLLVRRLARGPQFWRGSSYFAAIGLSFMLIEIPWLQRFVLYLGHPSIAAAVVIGALLLGAGLGASRAARLGVDGGRRWWWLVPIGLGAVNLLMSPLFAATLGAAEAVRIVISIALVMPIGFLLGHFFPLGMLRFGDEAKAWYWAINGACGVLAGVCSLALAMAFGFLAVAWMGVIGYLIAGLLFVGSQGRARAA
ncbi:MAG: hypothetical protein MUC36_11870 [Planctomycetes bacterium]|jgi:hypothetical protein|nr:hypothetical protein [Planctomycetota bacterium]